MKHFAFVVLASLAIPTLAHADRKIDCSKHPQTVIDNAEGTYQFTGKCTKIVVNGADNKLTIDSVVSISIMGADNTISIGGVDKISVMGSDNTITYKKTVSAKRTKIGNLGTGNKIKRVKK